MKKILPYLLLILLYSCKKETPEKNNAVPAITQTDYIQYTIEAGEHYCNSSTIKAVSVTEMNFMVKFDSSSIYKSNDSINQKDVNKLYGFSEGMDNHVNSARIGWAWYRNALRLYAYTYANGVRYIKEISAVEIGKDITCGIKVSGKEYIFTVNELIVHMTRAIETTVASGYQLYPYFGGDEVAPARVQILIKDIP